MPLVLLIETDCRWNFSGSERYLKMRFLSNLDSLRDSECNGSSWKMWKMSTELWITTNRKLCESAGTVKIEWSVTFLATLANPAFWTRKSFWYVTTVRFHLLEPLRFCRAITKLWHGGADWVIHSTDNMCSDPQIPVTYDENIMWKVILSFSRGVHARPWSGQGLKFLKLNSMLSWRASRTCSHWTVHFLWWVWPGCASLGQLS